MMPAAELLQRADLLQRANGRDLAVEMIGTEVGSWEQVINYSPERITLEGVTMNGAPIGPMVIAPYGAGDSIAYGAEVDRKRVPWRPTTVRYSHESRFVVATDGETTVHTYPLKVTASLTADRSTVAEGPNQGMPVVKSGRLSTLHTARRGWVHPAPRKARTVRKVATLSTLPSVTVDTAIGAITEAMLTAWNDRTDASVTYRIGATRVTATCNIGERSYRVTSSRKVNGKAKTSSRKVRTLAGVASSVRNLAS
jgi:hypothetical protein